MNVSSKEKKIETHLNADVIDQIGGVTVLYRPLAAASR